MLATSVLAFTSQGRITVGPNPFNETVEVVTNSESFGYVFIRDLTGKTITEKIPIGKSEKITFPTDMFLPGIYFVVLENETKIIDTVKIMKK